MDDDAAVFRALDELELREFFGARPVESEPADQYWAYEITDARGVALRFSFNLLERSVQTDLRLGGNIVSRVSSEGAVSMRRDGTVLRCDFRTAATKAWLTIDMENELRVTWSTLRTS